MTLQTEDKLPLKGGCLCQAIRYEISDEILQTGFCYCRSCQQATGSEALPFCIVKRGSLTITGDLKEFTKIGASGMNVHRGFCPNCGSTLFGRLESSPEIRVVSASSLDDPSQFIPKVDSCIEEAQPWRTLKAAQE